jgi:hypothetical protein
MRSRQRLRRAAATRIEDMPNRPPAPRRARWGSAVALALVVTAGLAPRAAAALELRLANGITATVHAPDDLLDQRIVVERGRTWLLAGPGLRYELVTDIRDPIIANKGDGAFHPMSVGAVVAALEEIRHDDAGLELEVFVLPYPRRAILDSSARRGMILLSPGVRPVSEFATHFTVAHEIGHVYQYAWMPDADTEAWRRYSALRGIEDGSVYSHGGSHENRPHEIFAEDFRYLFGGERANYSGTIENAELQLPGAVAGLESFVRELAGGRGPRPARAVLTGTPNPFNPGTEIRVAFDPEPPAGRATLQVIDIRGAVVRALYDGVPAARELRLAWDGRATDGRPIASGIYFARLEYDDQQVSTKLLHVK